MAITLRLDPDKSATDALLAGLIESTKSSLPKGDDYQSIGFFIEDASGSPAKTGLTGYAQFDWFYVEFLHVAPEMRGKGVGSELMGAAETWARQRGLAGMWLQTMAFQAPGFYEKLGFTTFATTEDRPVGSRTLFMNKRF
jgi:GNAT superfamily N-acetyltransferase